MTDNAKKTSELATSNTVVGSDRILILKDPTSSPSTRTITTNNFANSIIQLVQNPIPNTTFEANSVTVVSNGTSTVAVYSYSVDSGKTGCCHFTFHAKDSVTNSISGGSLMLVAIGNEANINYNSVAEIGSNPIYFDNQPTVNTSSNTVTIYMRRGSAATSNVTIRYSATIF
jgi:hypothetical protein